MYTFGEERLERYGIPYQSIYCLNSHIIHRWLLAFTAEQNLWAYLMPKSVCFDFVSNFMVSSNVIIMIICKQL